MYTLNFVVKEEFNISLSGFNRNKRILFFYYIFSFLNIYYTKIFHVCMYSRLINDNEVNQHLNSTGL